MKQCPKCKENSVKNNFFGTIEYCSICDYLKDIEPPIVEALDEFKKAVMEYIHELVKFFKLRKEFRRLKKLKKYYNKIEKLRGEKNG